MLKAELLIGAARAAGLPEEFAFAFTLNTITGDVDFTPDQQVAQPIALNRDNTALEVIKEKKAGKSKRRPFGSFTPVC